MNYLKFRGRSYSRFLLQTLLCSFLFLLLYSCNDHDEYAPLVTEHDHSGKSKSQYVSTESIPDIMDFISEASSGTGKFLLRSEDLAKNLSLDSVEIIADEALQVTNDYDLSNYTFKTKVVSEDKSVVQLVVKSTSWGEYGFFIQFKPSTDYLRNFTELDFFTYDGVVLIYDLNGEYIGSKTYSNGTPTSYDVVEECVVSDQGDGSDTGGGTGDGADTGDTGDTGTTGDPGGITDNSNITISVGCCNRNECDIHAPREPEPFCTGSTVIIDVTNKSGNNPLTESCVPCDVDCVNGHDDFCACLPDPDDTNENPDTGLIPELMFMLALDEFVELTEEQKDWIWAHPDHRDFAYDALDAFRSGGSADFEHRIIYEASLEDCVKDILTSLVASDMFINLSDMPQEVLEELNLSGVILDLANNLDRFNLSFEQVPSIVNDSGQPVNARTTSSRIPGSSPPRFNWNIAISSEFVNNATDLAIGRTIIHEMLHAYISYNYQFDNFGSLSSTYKELLSRSGYSPHSDPGQHLLMAEILVDAMAGSLDLWYSNDDIPNEYYTYLSWSGAMINTEAFELLPEDDQNNIIDANIAEGQAGDGNGATSDAKGQPCN